MSDRIPSGGGLTARTADESPKQVRMSGTGKELSRQGERLIEFLSGEVITFFGFITLSLYLVRHRLVFV
jgi:hypothetical protein